MKNVRPAASPRVGEGAIRAAIAGTVLLILSLWWPPQDVIWAYLAAGSAAVFGLLVVLKPGAIYRWRIADAAGNALVVSVIVADTGGGTSAFFPLYFPAALSLVNVAGRAGSRVRARAEGAGGAAILTGGYLFATLAVGGWGESSSPPFLLKMTLLVLFCASALLVGFEVYALRSRTLGLSATAAAEKDRAGRAAAQTGVLAPALAALDIESALGYTAEAARAVAGASYGHVASLRGNLHRTIMQGEFDACPSWWHPTVQRLVLWSCREGGIVRLENAVHGLEGFVAMPVGASGQEKWGAIVVGGGRTNPEIEHDLLRLAADMRPALERCPDAAGGLDVSSGLPNAASLVRTLRRELTTGALPVVLAAKLEDGVSPLTAEDLLGRLGTKLRTDGRRAFWYGEDALVLLAKSDGEAQGAEKARALLRVVNEESKELVGPHVEGAVGFAMPGKGAENPDDLVAQAILAIEDARGKSEKIAGVLVGAREPSGVAAADARPPSVQGFLKAMVARDPYLAGHSAGVSRVAGRIGRALALDQEQLEALAVGALLHDIGKIGIPDRILHKPGRLTDDEYAVIKRHPTIGADIVASIPELSSALHAIRHHHERFDGLGYPDGLRAEKIPLLARVIAVADAFDSMTRERPYGRRMSAGASLEEVVRQAGTQFDPKVAEALSQVALRPDDPRAGDVAV